jgi:class 3 adenylate cyclase
MVTTLFAEIRGFTSFAARVTPAEAVAALNDIFDRVCDIVGGAHGIVDRVLGDGMLAIFGAPYACDEHASAAARAALEVRNALAEPSRHRPRAGAVLRIGVGLNTGSVIGGAIASRDSSAYTVLGHAVNVAARLAANAHASQILIGPGTAALLPSEFDVRDRGTIDLAGIGPTAVFELVR